MARDQIDMTPIETRDELVAWLEAGCKPKAQFRVGTEHEKFAFTVADHRPVPYSGKRSIHALLEGMHESAWLGADHGGRQHHRHVLMSPAEARSRSNRAVSSSFPALRSTMCIKRPPSSWRISRS